MHQILANRESSNKEKVSSVNTMVIFGPILTKVNKLTMITKHLGRHIPTSIAVILHISNLLILPMSQLICILKMMEICLQSRNGSSKSKIRK